MELESNRFYIFKHEETTSIQTGWNCYSLSDMVADELLEQSGIAGLFSDDLPVGDTYFFVKQINNPFYSIQKHLNDNADLFSLINQDSPIERICLEQAADLQNALIGQCPFLRVCLSYNASSDFCVFVPISCVNYLESIDASIDYYIKKAEADYLEINDHYFDELNIQKDRIIKRFSSQKLYRYGRHYRDYMQILNALTSPEGKTVEELQEHMLIGALCLHTFLGEVYFRRSTPSGEILYEDSEVESLRETLSSEPFINLFNLCLKQSSLKNEYHDGIWSVHFLARAMLISIMKTSDCSDVEKKTARPYLYQHNNFFGFVPFFSKKQSEITSFYYDHLIPAYNFGFLAIPQRYETNLLECFPAFIHEFFHYIAQSNRCARNCLIVELVVRAVLFKLNEALLISKSFGAAKILNTFVENITLSLLSFTKTPIVSKEQMPDIKDEEAADSMAFLFKMGMLQDFDFKRIYERSLGQTAQNTPDQQQYTIFANIALSKMEECVESWKHYVQGYALSFTLSLREIRSDISMCHFIESTNTESHKALKRYIDIMAAEPRFAKMSDSVVADSTIIRFGFMTRYLFFKNRIQKVDETQNQIWKSTVLSILDEPSDFPGKDDHTARINLKGYILRYERINLGTTNYQNTHHGISLFEKFIYPQLFDPDSIEDVSSFTGSLLHEGIIKQWEDDLAIQLSHPLFKDLSAIYNRYVFLVQNKKTLQAMQLSWRSRFVFKNLFQLLSQNSYFENN